MSKMPIRNYPITTDNVNNLGGKELILKRMVNHYNALTKVKAKIDDSTPFLGIKKTESEKRRNLNQKEEFRNVREAYKKVSSVKPYIDNKKPFTYDMKPKNCFKSVKEKYDDIEHLRTLKAMQKRILSIGKMHERKKNRFDPIANPTYFFLDAQNKRDPKNEATKLISLKNLNEKLRKLNEKERNKLLLGQPIYDAVDNIDVDNWVQKCNKNIQRPKSAIQKNKIEDNKNNYNYNTNVKGTNSTLVEYNPEKFMQIHKFNRENEGEKIIQRRKKREEEKNRKNKSTIASMNSSKSKSMTFKSKINKKGWSL